MSNRKWYYSDPDANGTRAASDQCAAVVCYCAEEALEAGVNEQQTAHIVNLFIIVLILSLISLCRMPTSPQ